jgi:hypothetical protein
MSKQIQAQAKKLWGLVSSPETAGTYQKTGALTWTILKETGYLLWLVICLVLVFGEWLWKTGYGAGYRFRSWINDLERPTLSAELPSSDVTAAQLSTTGKNLLNAGKTRLLKAVETAREELGIERVTSPLEVTPPPATPPASTASATPPTPPTP